MSISPDTLARAINEAWWGMPLEVPGSWVDYRDGVNAVATMIPSPYLNGVFVETIDADVDFVKSQLQRVADSGVPYSIQLRFGSSQDLLNIPLELKMKRDPDVPALVLEELNNVNFSLADDLTLRTLPPEQAALHAKVAAVSFEDPVEYFVQLITPAVLKHPRVGCHIGEVNGNPVTTGIGLTREDRVGIFNIATLPEHRGHGYGAAVTAFTIIEGRKQGAKWAFLQSSPQGLAVYQRLGFKEVETWQHWYLDPKQSSK
jgi:N-acetylglutamate synthase